MSEPRFNVVFKGEIVPGANAATVRDNVAKLFKANEKVLERLFSGDPIAIKKDVDRAGAMKYRALMKQAGALCYSLDVNADISTVGSNVTSKAASQPTPVKPANTQQAASVAPATETKTSSGTSNETQQQALETGWTLAPAGAILVKAREIESIPMPDISGITLADPGVDIIENRVAPVFEPVPDVSNLGLAPVGANVTDPKPAEKVLLPDVSGIGLAPVGADVSDPVKKDFPKPPDVSGLGLAPPGVDLIEPSPKPEPPKVDISHLSTQ